MNPACELLTLTREKIPITIIIARNNRWWAEGLNQHLHYNKRYGGTCVESPSFACIAQVMGDFEQIRGIEVRELKDLLPSLYTATHNQMNGTTTG